MPVKTKDELKAELDAAVFQNTVGGIDADAVHALLLDMIDSAGTGSGITPVTVTGVGSATGMGGATAGGAYGGIAPDFFADFTVLSALPAWVAENHAANLSSNGLLIGSTDIATLTGGALALMQGSAFTVVIETSGIHSGGVLVGNGNNLFIGSGFDVNVTQAYNGIASLTATFPSGTWTNTQRSGYAGDGTGRSVVASGSTVHTDTGIFVSPPLTAVAVGNDPGGSSSVTGYIRSIGLYASRLSDSLLRTKTIVPGGLGAIDVMIVAGQSNATGYQDDQGSLSYSTDISVITVDTVADIVTYIPNTGFTGIETAHGSNRWAGEMEYSRQYRLANPSKKLAILKYTVPGTDLETQWNAHTLGGIYAQASLYFQSALSALTTVGYMPTVRLAYWMQGENDANNSAFASDYETNLTDLINGMRTDWGVGSAKVAVGRIKTAAGSFSAGVRTGEDNVASANPGGPVWIIDTDDLAVNVSDSLHYTAASQITIGQRLWAVDQATALPTPISFGTDLVGWWHADDATPSSWPDRSGNGYTLVQATGGNQPAVSSTSFMGKSGVTFDGSTSWMKATGVTLGTDKLTVYAFAQYTFSTVANQRLIGFEGNAVGNDFTSPGSGILIECRGDVVAVDAYRSGRLSVFQVGVPPDATIPTQGIYYRMGSEWDGTNHIFYAENESSTPVASAGNFASPGNLRIGAYMDGAAAFYQGAIREIIVTKNTVTSTQRQALMDHLARDWTRVLLTEGDSITWSPPVNSGFTFLFLPHASPPVMLQDRAIGGSRLADLVARVSTNLYPQIPSNKWGKQYVVFVGIGANDIMNYNGNDNLHTSTAAAQYAAALASYCAGIKAAGADKIVISTIMSRIDSAYPDQDIFRHPYNTLIRNTAWQSANGIDAVADFAADSIMGVDLAPSVNPTYFADEVHPNAAGNARLETIFRATINGL